MTSSRHEPSSEETAVDGLDEKAPDPGPAKVEDGLKRIVTARDWTGPEDPENPHNWPLWQRVYHTIIPGVFGFVVTFGSSVYTPGYPEVMKRFDVSSTVALLGLSLYVLGLGFGPVLAAPISETLGRRVVYLVSLPLAAFFTLGAGFSQNFASLAILRFLAGCFGSPVLAVGAGTIVDIWEPIHRAAASAAFLLAPFLLDYVTYTHSLHTGVYAFTLSIY